MEEFSQQIRKAKLFVRYQLDSSLSEINAAASIQQLSDFLQRRFLARLDGAAEIRMSRVKQVDKLARGVESEVGKGSCFTVVLPLVMAETNVRLIPDSSCPPASGRGASFHDCRLIHIPMARFSLPSDQPG
jgi:hypothetical protein